MITGRTKIDPMNVTLENSMFNTQAGSSQAKGKQSLIEKKLRNSSILQRF